METTNDLIKKITDGVRSMPVIIRKGYRSVIYNDDYDIVAIQDFKDLESCLFWSGSRCAELRHRNHINARYVDIYYINKGVISEFKKQLRY